MDADTEKTRRMRLAFETVVWGRRVEDLDHMLGVLAACGYEGVEFGQSHRDIFVWEKSRRQPIGTIERLEERLRAHGLQLIGLVGGKLTERMAFCGGNRSAYLYLDSWADEYAKALEGDAPFRLAIHPHWFMPIRKLPQVEKIFERFANPNLRLIVDTAHAVIAEDDPVQAVKKHFSRLEAVHLKDWRPDYGRWSHRYANGFCLPGDGIVPVRQVFSTLVELGYRGWVIMEQDHFHASREHTALKCAEWAHQHSRGELKSPCPDATAVDRLAKTSRRGGDFSRIEGAEDIAKQLALAPAKGPQFFYPEAARLLRNTLGLEAVKIWSYNPFTNELYLVGGSLAEHLEGKCKTILRADDALTGKIVEAQRIIVEDLDDRDVRGAFDDPTFLERLESRWMVGVPIFNSANAHHLRYVLTLFTNQEFQFDLDGELVEANRRHFEHYADLLSVWADFLTDEMCSSASGSTNHLCGEAKPAVVPFVNDLRDHLKRHFKCEGVSVFLLDESRSRLQPVGDSVKEIEWNDSVAMGERFYRKGEGITGKTWSEREFHFTSNAEVDGDWKGKSRERTADRARKELLTAPLARRRGDFLGVIRLHNKHPRETGSPAATAFTDDDAARLDAVVQAVVPHLELLNTQRRQSFALVRLAHELQNPLIGITGAADFLREKLLKLFDRKELASVLGVDYVEDIFAYQRLMSRLVQNANLFASTIDELRPRFEHTDLLRFVITPVQKQLKPLLERYHLSAQNIRVSSFQGVVPWLWVDRLMMQQVFFNLFVNAIKYHDKSTPFRIEVRAEIDGTARSPQCYLIDVEDDGIGLDPREGDGEEMFLPGVRGANIAQLHDVTGTGVGLAVVRSVITAHGGTVRFHERRKPTIVRVSLPATLRHGPPRPN